jgi:DNA-binding NarL/FixJ family response regulator
MKQIRVLIADDHHVVRTAVASFLNREPDIEVVGEVGEATQLVSLVGEIKPDVLLLDAHMPGQNVVRAARQLVRQQPRLAILVLSAYDRREYVVGLLRAGASGYVLKDDTPEMLVRAVRSVAAGQEWLSPRVLNILMKSVRGQRQRPFADLTPREMEVLRLMARGSRNEEIADELVITQQTVKNHVRSIFSKLGVETRVDAVLYAIEHELDKTGEEPGAG